MASQSSVDLLAMRAVIMLSIRHSRGIMVQTFVISRPKDPKCKGIHVVVDGPTVVVVGSITKMGFNDRINEVV